MADQRQRVVLDTGPLVAFFSPRDQHHAWALAQSKRLATPMVTCEAVLSEAYYLLGRVPNGRRVVRAWLRAGRVDLGLDRVADYEAVLDLLDTYADQGMDWADACVVRLAERTRLPVFTTDLRDFSVYRLHGSEAIPLLAPPVR